VERRAVIVRGIVQGVGFRPFVYALAKRLFLDGFVRNSAGAVLIEIEGDRKSLEHFIFEVQHVPPPLAKIESVSWRPLHLRGEAGFRVEPSVDTDLADGVFISPDVATCPDCLSELFDPSDRRYKYSFLNCTNCGPRLTIIEGAPYDRPRTTMKSFPLCRQCHREYEDPADRRFHAQPIACPVCGPRLEAIRLDGTHVDIAAPLDSLTEVLRSGGIAAIKGIGGYHLACDARNEELVRELRRRKHRDDKPFAVMVADAAAARRFCVMDRDEQELLESSRRPIVLLRRRNDGAADQGVCESVAPGNPYLGIMLPYTPLHHLIFDALPEVPLVMTSGNRSDEPISYLDGDAVERLGPIADLIVRHNRAIHVRCDDSVSRVVAGVEMPIRRSRGYAPQPITLRESAATPILAVGSELKGTFALANGRHVVLSHHLGDLDNFDVYKQFERDISLYEQLFRITPRLIVHDLHPDYASTRYAIDRARADGMPTLAVQHHHAHMASCMAEHGLAGPVIGVTFDGTGYGVDERTHEATIWGGEFLVGDCRTFRRATHLRYVAMPGGDRAAREPWRMAVSQLLDAECDADLVLRRVNPDNGRVVQSMLARRLNSPLTSSVGRLFDAVAAIAGVRDISTFEGQAAMQLEWLATDIAACGSYLFEISQPEVAGLPATIDTRPIVRAVANDAAVGTSARTIARRFHSTLVDVIKNVCVQIREQTGIDHVMLSGGVFLNVLLTREVLESLAAAGFRVFRHEAVPPNDGGISLGQAAVAIAHQGQTESKANKDDLEFMTIQPSQLTHRSLTTSTA
jgi:hydrogenase maturation protein HypF